MQYGRFQSFFAPSFNGFWINPKTSIREDRVKKIKSIREHVKENEEQIRSVDKRITINKEQVWSRKK